MIDLPESLSELWSALSPKQSMAMAMALLPEQEREHFLAALTEQERLALEYAWWYWARKEQLAPPESEDWFVWLCNCGRGWGKTRVGAEWVHRRAMEGDERRWIAVVAKTPGEARDVMIEGPAGIRTIAPSWERPDYEPTKRRLTWPTGARATVYSGAHPDQIRGFSGDTMWADEPASWKYAMETWDNALLGMREAKIEKPRVVATTTPRPNRLMKRLLSGDNPWIRTTQGSSYDNFANLSRVYYEAVIKPLEGTTLGQQEIYAKLLSEDPRALWKRGTIAENRRDKHPTLIRIVVAIDPAGGGDEDNDEVGICVAGLGADGHGYVLEDRSARMTAGEWGQEGVDAYVTHEADRIIGESNFGGDMVEATIKAAATNRRVTVAYKKVHASRGKTRRFEPVAALDEQGRVHHVGVFTEMEDEMVTWVDNQKPAHPSPNRTDARAWAITELMLGGTQYTGEMGGFSNEGLTRVSKWVR